MSNIQHDINSMHNDIDRIQQKMNEIIKMLKIAEKDASKSTFKEKMKTKQGRKELIIAIISMFIMSFFIIFCLKSCDDDTEASSSTKENIVKSSVKNPKFIKRSHLKKGDLVFVAHPKDNSPTIFDKATNYATWHRFDYADKCYDVFDPHLSDQFERGHLSDVSIQTLPNGLKLHSFKILVRVPFHNKISDTTYMGICSSYMTQDKQGKFNTKYRVLHSTQLFVKSMS